MIVDGVMNVIKIIHPDVSLYYYYFPFIEFFLNVLCINCWRKVAENAVKLNYFHRVKL